MKKKKQLIAICGLDCYKCPAYIATVTRNDKLKVATAKKWTLRNSKEYQKRPPIRPIYINCKGCLSTGPIYLYCRQCKIRKCAFDKKVKNCKECKNYKCEQLIELQSHFY